MDGNIMALDVGMKRTGIALAHTIARLPHPHATVPTDDAIWSALHDICQRESVVQIVVGLPRNLSGDDTQQTQYARAFAERAAKALGVPVALQDEALTSHLAEQELGRRGGIHDKGAVDALAAVYILQDYLAEQGVRNG